MTASRLDCAAFRAAQANLNVPAVERRRTDATQRKADNDRDRERRIDRQTRASHVAFLRDERKRLKADLRDLTRAESDIRADSFYSRDPATLQGALEELDSMREQKLDRIYRIESDLRRA